MVSPMEMEGVEQWCWEKEKPCDGKRRRGGVAR
jgi:hypothetical protein